MSPRRVLVTGITGQDGSLLAERLVAGGDEVVGLVRPGSVPAAEAPAALREHVELVEADLDDPAGLRAAVERSGAEEVFHLAAPTFVPASWDDPGRTMREIAGATGTVLAAAGATGARVLVPSSPEVFGEPGVSPQREDTPRRPRNPYGAAKLAAQELVRVARDGRGVHACAVITYNHESPRRPPRFVTRKITRAAAAISLGLEREVVLGDLDARRDWTHAADVVRGMVLALRHERPDDYVLAGGRPRTVREFAEAAFAVVGLAADDHVVVDPDLVRPPEATVLTGDATHARTVLGWQPEIAFEDLVREMVEADLARLKPGSDPS